MKKLLIILAFAFLFTACGDSPTVSQYTKPANTSNPNDLIARGHRTQPTTQPSNSSSSEGSPMRRDADVKTQTEAIEKAETAYKAKSKDEGLKKALAKAYFDRAFILTNAAQYSAALADFRKGLKLDPADEKAKDMHDQIVDIYGMVGKPVPKEGEEDAPNQPAKPKQ